MKNPSTFLTLTSRMTLAFGFYYVFARYRLVDLDEGNYLMMARLVVEGALPYRDFMFPQMPVTLFVYAAWIALIGSSWLKARILPALMVACIATMISKSAEKRFGSSPIGWAVFFSFLLSAPIFQKYPLATTYPVAGLSGYLGFYFLSRVDGMKSLWGGLFLGLAASTRLFFIPVIFVGAAWIFWYRGRGPRGRAAVLYSAGILAGLLPALVMWWMDREAFEFCNLEFHALRYPGGLFGPLWSKIKMIGIVLIHPQHAAVLVLALWGAYKTLGSDKARREPALLAAAMGLLLWVEHLVPNPTYYDYFSIPYLFLFVGAMPAFENSAFLRGKMKVFLLLFIMAGLPHILAVPYHRSKAPGITLDKILESTKIMEQYTQPNDVVISQWPGYLWASNRRPLPGLENSFSLRITPRMSKEDLSKYNLTSHADLMLVIRQRKASFVIWNYHYKFGKGLTAHKVLTDAGYRMVTDDKIPALYLLDKPPTY